MDFVETLFGCMQQIKQCTTDSVSMLDLIFSNSEGFCDVIEAYCSDHKLIYCALDKQIFKCCDAEDEQSIKEISAKT